MMIPRCIPDIQKFPHIQVCWCLLPEKGIWDRGVSKLFWKEARDLLSPMVGSAPTAETLLCDSVCKQSWEAKIHQEADKKGEFSSYLVQESAAHTGLPQYFMANVKKSGLFYLLRIPAAAGQTKLNNQ